MTYIWRYEARYEATKKSEISCGYVLSKSDEASTVITELYDFFGEGYKITSVTRIIDNAVDLTKA